MQPGYLFIRIISLLLISTANIFAQSATRTCTLVINGHQGQAQVIQSNGREYVDLQAFARSANASIGIHGDDIVLTLPGALAAEGPPTPPPESPTSSAFSQEFMKAGIELIALLREWASPLAYAIQNGYPITDQWAAGYRDEAAHGLDLASVVAKTDADRNALQLLSNEFQAVREWSNRLVDARKTMDTAKYAMSETALREDPLSQKIITCAHFLGPMLGSGTFQDNSSCH